MTDQERRGQEQARARKNFAGAFARGQVAAVDRFGRPINEGDSIIIAFDPDPVVSVVSVNPVLDPKVPAGYVDVTCTITFPLRVVAGQPYMGATIIMKGSKVAMPDGAQSNGSGPSLSLVPSEGAEEAAAEPSDTPDPEDGKIIV